MKGKPQATRYTRRQIECLEHWEAKGYTFAPGEMPPGSEATPPSLATRRPKLDAALSVLVMILGALVLFTLLAGLVMGWLKWHP